MDPSLPFSCWVPVAPASVTTICISYPSLWSRMPKTQQLETQAFIMLHNFWGSVNTRVTSLDGSGSGLPMKLQLSYWLEMQSFEGFKVQFQDHSFGCWQAFIPPWLLAGGPLFLTMWASPESTRVLWWCVWLPPQWVTRQKESTQHRYWKVFLIA